MNNIFETVIVIVYIKGFPAKCIFPRLLESQSKVAEKLLFQKAPGATTKTAKTRKIDESYTHLSCGF